jgi:hypothetical protein
MESCQAIKRLKVKKRRRRRRRRKKKKKNKKKKKKKKTKYSRQRPTIEVSPALNMIN